MNIAPDAETLAEIGRATAQSARAFGHEPRVAFLSFSTRDSAKDGSIDRDQGGGGAGAPGRARAPRRRRDAVRRRDPARGREEEVPGQPARGTRQRLHLPRPQLRQHRLQDHRAAGRREGDRPDPPGAATSRSTTSRGAARSRTSPTWPRSPRCRRWGRPARPNGATGRQARRSPHSAWAIATAATAAVSARRMRGPREAAMKPAATERVGFAGLEAAGRADEQQQRPRRVDRERGQRRVARRLEQDDSRAVERPRDEPVQGRGRGDFRHDRAPALLGGARRRRAPSARRASRAARDGPRRRCGR